MDGDSNGAAGEAKRSLSKEALVRDHRGQPPNRLALKEVRKLLGAGCTLEGEDPEIYEELLNRIGDAVQSKDMIDWLLVKDVVELTRQIHRLRHHRERMLLLSRGKAMADILNSLEYSKEYVETYEHRHRITRLAQRWLRGDEEGTEYVLGLLEEAGLSAEDVIEQAMRDRADELDRIDDRTESYERRRDSLLQQIERRHAGFGRLVNRASEEVIEAEYEEVAPDSAVPEAAAPN
jgi:hypothetical protein